MCLRIYCRNTRLLRDDALSEIVMAAQYTVYIGGDYWFTVTSHWISSQIIKADLLPLMKFYASRLSRSEYKIFNKHPRAIDIL